MFSFGSKNSPSTLEIPDYKLEVREDGLYITGSQELSGTDSYPKSLEQGIWNSRAQLVEAGLAEAIDKAGHDAAEMPTEIWAALKIPFDSLVWLKNGFATPSQKEANPDVFDPILSELFPSLTEWMLKIEPNTNVLVSQELQLEVSFWQAGQQVYPRRFGPWLISYGQASLLNQTQWQLCELVVEFNRKENKNEEVNFSTLAQLYEQLGLGLPQNVRLEAILEDTVILAPSRITMGWQQDSDSPDATQSAYPVLLNLPIENADKREEFEAAFRQEFFKYDKGRPTYSLPALSLSADSPSKRVRILLPPALQDAATHMRQSVRGLNKSVAQAIALAPDSHFEEVCTPDALALDLQTYGPRVVGLGPLVFKPVLKVRTLDRVCLLEDGWDRLAAEDQPGHQTLLEIQGQKGNGEPESLVFKKNSPAFEKAAQIIQEALDRGESGVTITDDSGKQASIMPTPQLAHQIAQATVAVKAASSKTVAHSGPPVSNAAHNRHLKALSNEEQKLYDEIAKRQQDSRPMLARFGKPQALIEKFPNGDPLVLAEYQKEGIAWLQTTFLSGKPGVLLADDMGLGKTLQVLSFLAWLFETGWSQRDDGSAIRQWAKVAIWDTLLPGEQYVTNPHPALVVVPKMLMDNWKAEIKKFFLNDGDIFSNYEFLDSKSIKNYALPRMKKGNDFRTGEPSLNIQLLRSNRLIIANYDTVKNYYHSLAKIHWSCLVMDESQEIKNPGTAVTHAMACIASNARFKITMTGTPIENDLIDLWTLFDVAAPGLLGSAKEFRQFYFLGEKTGFSHGWALDKLKETLGCKTLLKEAQPTSYVLGRNKRDFLGDELPPLADVSEAESIEKWPENVEPLNITCRFRYTPMEWQQQDEILAEIAQESKRGRALKAIQYIKSFSEHPWLATRSEEPADRKYDTEHLLQSSSKFRWLYETLQHIRNRREKVLIFTRSIQMQTWIYNLLKERFSIDFEPINGTISSKKEAGSSRTTAILKRFEEHPGFAALVLSPEVAGVGLNITAANHVIHYGRWWNPAKEDQATCRAYRKGQNKAVYLYVPIGDGPNGETSFDDRLDSLLRSKSMMRQDFLTPTGGMELSPDETAFLIPGFEEDAKVCAQAEGREFEGLVADWMKSHGFEMVQVTPCSKTGASMFWGLKILSWKWNSCFGRQSSGVISVSRMLWAYSSMVEQGTHKLAAKG